MMVPPDQQCGMLPEWAFPSFQLPLPAGLPAAPPPPALPPPDAAHFYTSAFAHALSLHRTTFCLQSCFLLLNMQLNAPTLCAPFSSCSRFRSTFLLTFLIAALCMNHLSSSLDGDPFLKSLSASVILSFQFRSTIPST